MREIVDEARRDRAEIDVEDWMSEEEYWQEMKEQDKETPPPGKALRLVLFGKPPARGPYEREEPHAVGPVECWACGHGWVAVRPEGTEVLECPSCGEMMGACGRFGEVEGEG